jgi:cytochrome-b5 reductase
VVKAYPKGKVSSYLHSLSVGDTIEVKGPFQKLQYEANMKKRIGMIAGGTGITPMIQVIKQILSNKDDVTEVDLLFANTGEEDVLMRPFLDQTARVHRNFRYIKQCVSNTYKNVIRVHYLLSRPPTTTAGLWRGLSGHVNAALISRLLPEPSPDTLVYVCGPPGLMAAVSGDKISPADQGPLQGSLLDLGYTSKSLMFHFAFPHNANTGYIACS